MDSAILQLLPFSFIIQQIEQMEVESKGVKVMNFYKTTNTNKTQPNKQLNEQIQDIKVKAVNQQQRYTFLLKRLTDLLLENNPELNAPNKLLLKPPQSTIISLQRTILTNFAQICKQVNRHPQHMMHFFTAQIGKEGLMVSQGFMIRMRLKIKQVEQLYKKYIRQYVRCSACKGYNTELIKCGKMKLWVLHCHMCKSSRSVPTLNASWKKYADYEKQKAIRQHKEKPQLI